MIPLLVGRGPAEPITPVEPTASVSGNTFPIANRSIEAGSSVIYGRVVHRRLNLPLIKFNRRGTSHGIVCVYSGWADMPP